MTGQEAIELIHQRAWTGRKPGLERTQALLASLGNPERRLRFVHITGTNGKGSTAAMTASILAQAGLRAGSRICRLPLQVLSRATCSYRSTERRSPVWQILLLTRQSILSMEAL